MTKQEHREITSICIASMREATGIEWSIKIETRRDEPVKFSAMPATSDIGSLSPALLAFADYHAKRGWQKATLSDAAFALLISWCIFNQRGAIDV
jgi:hypothetical protein